MFKIDDYVTRKSYHNDLIFKIIKIDDDIATLLGFSKRLIADANVADLELVKSETLKEKENENLKRLKPFTKLHRHKLHMTGKILHIDGDNTYLEKCLKLYKDMGLPAYGVHVSEVQIKNCVLELIDRLNPDIIVITGHDSYNKKGIKDLKNYRNTNDYVEAVKLIRKHYSKDHIFIFAGACQSNFEALMAAGANFASSPKRVNIDAYDPAIVAIKAAVTPFSDIIDINEIKELLDHQKDGISGIESYGKMRLFL